MRLLFVVGHPAHVHLFRNAIKVLRARGHVVRVAAVDKETTLRLLQVYGLEYTVIGRSHRAMVSKALDLPVKDMRLLRILARERPDIVVSTGSPYAAQASAVVSIPHIAFSDTEIATTVIRLMEPFTDAVCTPSCFQLALGPRQVRYDGYKELAYLHPSYFQPDPSVLEMLNVDPSDILIILRFSSWDSSHDLAERGMRETVDRGVLSAIAELESKGKVVVTSERGMPPQLERLAANIPLERVHDLLYYATLYVGEGATMASEAGVLGTPWVFISREGRGFLEDQATRYGLGFREATWGQGLARANTLLSNPRLKAEWTSRRARMLADKIDVTDFIVRFIEDWPKGGPDKVSAAAGAGRGRTTESKHGGT